MNGSNNTFLGSNTGFKAGITYYSSSIALGAGATITNYNQLLVSSNITAFNMAGLTPSTGTGTGTILESSNVLPMAGTYKTVAFCYQCALFLLLVSDHHCIIGHINYLSTSSTLGCLIFW